MKFYFSVMKLSCVENSKIRLYIAFFGLCISLLSLCTDGLVNRDGILYIQTAQVFNESGFIASFNQYKWPFYSIMISFCHSITALSFEHSAYLLNIIFLLVLVDAFVQLYWEINSKIKYRWMPALIILAYTGLNDYRPMIIRDFGYWAFLFKALLYFVRANKYENLKSYTLWQIYIIASFLFRVEGFVFMLVLPLFCLVKKRTVIPFFYSVFLLLVPFAIMIYLDWSGFIGGRVAEIFAYLDVTLYYSQFLEYAQIVAQYALSHHAESNAVLFVTSGLLGVLFIQAITKLGFLYIAIGVLGKFRYNILDHFKYTFINWMIGLSFIILFVFFGHSKVISGRYVIQITLFLLFYVTYYSECILKEIKVKERSLWMIFFGSFLFINLVIGIHHSNSNKRYIEIMGDWVKNNIPDSASMVVIDIRLYYYSNGVFNKNIDITNKLTLEMYEYTLLKIKKGEKKYNELIKQGKLELVHSIVGQSQDTAVLFKINNH